ncbi:MAG: hypothetical protein JO034_24835 [Singulisphaera sp.]|nr:hypothetical protein [Singulisphaera sp.]
MRPLVRLKSLQPFFYQVTGDLEDSRMKAWKAIDEVRQERSAAMANLDAFWLFVVMALLLIPQAFLFKKSVAEEGIHLGAG